MEIVNRKKLMLRNISEDTKQFETKFKDYENNEQSTRIMNEMVINVRTLLYRTRVIKEDIEHTKQPQALAGLQAKMEEYKKFQKSQQIPFFSPTQLDQSMAGAFVMRLCREMSYWASCLYFVLLLIEEIDELFLEQKKNGELNIELIYFLAIKKINAKADEVIKVTYDNVMGALNAESSEEETFNFQNDIYLDPISLLAIERDKNLAKMKEMQEYMQKMISKIYRGLEIVYFDPIRLYKMAMPQEFNLDSLFKKQLKRNKQLKKQLQEYTQQYSAYRKKKMKRIKSYAKLQEKTNKVARTTSNLKDSIKSLVLLKDSVKQQRNSKLRFPVLAPSKFDNQNGLSLGVSRSNSRGGSNMLISSKQKERKWQRKQNNLFPKHSKLKL